MSHRPQTIARAGRSRRGVLAQLLLLAGAVLMLLPFAWAALTALKTPAEAIAIPMKLLPAKPQWSHFAETFDQLPFARYYWNTAATTIVKTLAALLISSMAGYAFARVPFPGKSVLFVLVLSVLMVPAQVFLVPQYMLMKDWGWLNSLKAITVTGMFSAYGTFLLRQFFLSLPVELEEAAKIDGCRPPGIYWRIMLPLAKPGLVAFGIISALWSWNDFMWPLIVNSSPDKMTLAVGLATLQGQYTTNYPLLMAGMLLAIAPMILLFLLLQRQFVEGMTLSGLK
ncbi:carbohydrate ABC transporter permease [Cohnella nanjingensis]|uniref:Carbohydrate ABC transporter permease n=1 Tax=Cohnella nanjingensis TaxID=1387779 RepID=A0A7X0VI13_9BACL|nr:carbohydrate ABC transporter permease [Cohnella nanjingensis]MBB6674048.1 carbohydrate ABC transporter permease [Cohnella nanjingensis]